MGLATPGWGDREKKPIFEEFQPYLQGRGTYRLSLETEAGPWSVVYKNDVRAPSMSAFQEYWFYGNLRSTSSAPTEYLIYKAAENALAKYLPRTYLCTEVIPGRHYQYLIEDLHNHRLPLGASIPEVAAELPAVHAAMREWARTVHSDAIFRIDALRHSLGTDLESYARKTSDEVILKVCRLWARLYDQNNEFTEIATQPVHGDLWPVNILVRKDNPYPIKIIDWESVLWGVPHADLATMLWGAKPSVEQEALVLFSRNDKNLTLHEHARLYRWCQEEHCVLSAAGYIKEHMEYGARGPVILPKHLGKRIARLVI